MGSFFGSFKSRTHVHMNGWCGWGPDGTRNAGGLPQRWTFTRPAAAPLFSFVLLVAAGECAVDFNRLSNRGLEIFLGW